MRKIIISTIISVLYFLSSYSQPIFFTPTGDKFYGAINKIDFTDNSNSIAYEFKSPTGTNLTGFGYPLCDGGNGKAYGIMENGGEIGAGHLFNIDLATGEFKIIYSATKLEYTHGIMKASNGLLYFIMDSYICSFNISTNEFKKLIGVQGSISGSFTEANNGNLYIVNKINNGDFIMEYDISKGSINFYNIYLPNTSFFYSFDGTLAKDDNGILYGIGNNFGSSYVIYSFNPSTKQFTKINEIPTSGFCLGHLSYLSNKKISWVSSFNYNSQIGKSTDQVYTYDLNTNQYELVYEYVQLNNTLSLFFNITEASDNRIYIPLFVAENRPYGSVFSMDLSGNNIEIIDFLKSNGANPAVKLIQMSNGKLFSSTGVGGKSGVGNIYSFDITNKSISDIKSFEIPDGGFIKSELLQNNNGLIYGITSKGGINSDKGGIFSVDPATNTFSKIQDFSESIGGNNNSRFVPLSDGTLISTTSTGGKNDYGTIFKFDPKNNVVTKLIDLDKNLSDPCGPLVLGDNGKFYGISSSGGTNNKGAIYSFDITTNSITRLYNFPLDEIYIPNTDLVKGPDGKLYGSMKTPYGNLPEYSGYIFSFNPSLNEFKKEYIFENNTTSYEGGFILNSANGSLYGIRRRIGQLPQNSVAFIYQYNILQKKFDIIYNFLSSPSTTLTFGSDRKLYGSINENGLNYIFTYDLTQNLFAKTSTIGAFYGPSMTEISKTIGITDATVYESAGVAVLNVQLTNPSAKDISINYVSSDGTATVKATVKNNPGDYNAVRGTLTIKAGSKFGTIIVPINKDAILESDEFFRITISTSSKIGYTLSKPIGKVTIKNGDAPIPLKKSSSLNVINQSNSLNLSIFPNPSNGEFNLKINSDVNDEAFVRVIDITGNIIHQEKLPPNTSFKFGQSIKSGLYFVEVIQGNNRLIKKIIKN